jgi:hypothetical protein
MPEAFFRMWFEIDDSYIQKDNSHGIRTSVPDQKSLLPDNPELVVLKVLSSS